MDSKNTYHEEKIFEVLENWERADVPDFFETRILARLENVRPSKAVRWGWASLVIILMANGFAATRFIKQSRSKNEKIYEEYLQTNPNVENYYLIQS